MNVDVVGKKLMFLPLLQSPVPNSLPGAGPWCHIPVLNSRNYVIQASVFEDAHRGRVCVYVHRSCSVFEHAQRGNLFLQQTQKVRLYQGDTANKLIMYVLEKSNTNHSFLKSSIPFK